MPIDLSKLKVADSSDTLMNPRELFSVLRKLDEEKYKYPRDVQSQVWTKWFARKDEKDLVLKMNTGSGKTVVGLLILKSCLNEKKGPAVYIAPDGYLVEQVCNEARDLGIAITDDKDDILFRRGKSILVTTLKTLVNGLSSFGVGERKIDIGSILIDDAHACVEMAEGQFTTTLDGSAYSKIVALFKEDLKQQSESGVIELEQSEPGKFMLVPFWAWSEKLPQVLRLLQDIKAHLRVKEGEPGFDDYTKETISSVRFDLPLIEDVLRNCRCVLGSGQCEISPHVLPIGIISSFEAAKRRIVMSATLSDDSVMVSHFDMNPASIVKTVAPDSADDIGDRMILVPQEINPDFTDADIQSIAVELSKQVNVVVIVPSKFRIKFWESYAGLILTAKNMSEGVARLKAGHVGLTVMLNKYDGIDLPKSACQVLLIDGLPDIRRAVDKIDDSSLFESDLFLSQRIQRIEQGMGRGVRSRDDHCFVMLMGKSLINFLYKSGARQRFSITTQKQIELSEELANQIAGEGLESLWQLAEILLTRNPEWVSKMRGSLATLKPDAESVVRPSVIKQREAFAAAQRNDHMRAVSALQEAVNAITEDRLKGWFMHQLASYQHALDAGEAQLILKKALIHNPRLTKPIAGVDYKKLTIADGSQASLAYEFFRKHKDAKHYMINVDGILSALVFAPETANEFEEAVKEIGAVIGFKTQRPEKDFKCKGHGPDDLWALGGGEYWVIECKNGATSANPICRHDCDQLNGSMVWFRQEYDAGYAATPVIIHPKDIHESSASLPSEARVMTEEELSQYCSAVRSFANSIAHKEGLNASDVSRSLDTYNLTKGKISKYLRKLARAK